MFFDVKVLLVVKYVLLNDMLIMVLGKIFFLGFIISVVISLFKD